MKRALFIASVGLVIAVTGLVAQGGPPVPLDPRLGSLQGDLENAKILARQEKYDEAIARAEAAIGKIKALRDQPETYPDLVILALSGDGNRVTATVKNQGDSDLIVVDANGRGRTFAGFNVKIINANTNTPFDAFRPLQNNFVGSLPPGQTANVAIGPITGCGGQAQPIKAIVSTRATEKDTNNNTSDAFSVRGGPCGS